MAKRSITNIKEYINKHRRRSVRQYVLIAVAALVVFCTTYAMILPAITMEGKVVCGKEEHIHQQSCYCTEKILVCELEEGKKHSHEENCYNSNGDLICKVSTSELHTHTDECYKEKIVMACGKTMHEHTSACFESVQQTTEKATSVTEELTSESTTENSSESSSKEISKADNSKTGVKSSADSTSEIKDLKEYLETELGGEVYHTVYDNEGKIVPDTTLVSGEGYIFSLTIKAKGIMPGTYQYTLPAEFYLPVEEYNGEITGSSSESVGNYSTKQDDSVVIIITFDENINNYQDFAGVIEFDIAIDNGGEKPKDPAISKTGAFNEADGMFDFKIEATIPAHSGNDLFKEWYIFDESRVTGVGSWVQSLDDAVISITYNEVNKDGETVEKTVDIPNITKVDETDNIAYICSDITGYDCLYLVNRCKCNETLCGHLGEEDCMSLSEEFGDEAYDDYDEWCTCWNLDKNAVLSIEYKNNKHGNNKDLLNSYAGKNYINDVSLASDDDTITASVSVPIPDLISKSLTEKFSSDNNYKGEYTVYVNKSMVDLSKVDSNNDGVADTEVIINDTMTNVSYIPGSISIVATNAEGSSDTLVYGTDYEIEYIPGSEDLLTTYNSKLNIAIKKLGAYMYTIKYNGQAISNKEEGTSVNIKTNNQATLSIYNYPSSDVNFTCYFRQNWSYLKRILTIEKTDIDDGKLLPGAVYGLFTEDGYEIARGTTDGVGLYDFKTNVREGIIFEEKTAYYIKEIDAPDGYSLDTSLHWFYFAKERVEELELLYDGIILFDLDDDGSDDFNKMKLTDEKGIKLPETGGCGTGVYTVAGLILLCGSAYVLHKKYLHWKGVLK